MVFGQSHDLTNGRGAAPGVAGHQIELAASIGIGDTPAQDFDRHQNRREGVVEFMNDVAHLETEHIGGGGGAEQKGGHGRNAVSRFLVSPRRNGRDYRKSGNGEPLLFLQRSRLVAVATLGRLLFGVANQPEITRSDFSFFLRTLTFLSASSLARFGRVCVASALVWIAVADGRAAPGGHIEVGGDPDVDGSMPEDYFPGLKTMIGQALKQSPSLIVNEMNIEVAQAQKLYAGIAPMLPHLGGWIYGGEQIQAAAANSGIPSNRSTGFYYDVLLSQPVFQWGQLKNGLLVQKIAVAINQRNYATVYMQFTQNLRHTYLSLISAKIALRNARFNLELRNKAYDAAQEQFKAGVITAAASAGPQMDKEDAQIAAETSEQVYLFARQQLGRMIGRREIPDEEIPSAMPPPKFSTSAASDLTADLLRTGARYTPDAQLGLLNIKNWALQYQINKVNLLPRVSATAELNQQNNSQVTSTGIIQNALTTESYYLRADWSIFDGLATRGRKEEALVHRRQAERDLKMKVDTTMDAAQNSQKMVELAWRQLDLSTRRDWINQQFLKRAEDDLASHVGSSDAVASARANAYFSEYTLTISRGNFLTQWSDFVSLVGHDPVLNNLPARYVRPIQ